MKIFSFKVSKITYILLFLFILSILLTLGSINLKSVRNTTEIFLSSVFPSLFPFILFTEITLKTDIIPEISKYLSFIPKLFKLNNNCAIPIILGFLCGFPAGAKAVDTMLHNKQITKQEANILMSFVNNCSPVFILTAVGIAMMNSITIGIILLISHILSSILIGIFYSRIYLYNIIHEKINFSNSYYRKTEKNEEKTYNMYEYATTFEIIKKSILNTFITLAFILGFMIMFNMIADIVYLLFNSLNILNNSYILDFISGLFEVTRGAKSISSYSNYFNNLLTISFLLGFSGLSVIFQIKSCLKNINISFKKLIIFKIVHGILSVFIAYILLKYTNILNISNVPVFSDTQITNYYRKQIYTAYIHSIALILLILSTYFMIRHERIIKEKN